jgi:hypothetical protein
MTANGDAASMPEAAAKKPAKQTKKQLELQAAANCAAAEELVKSAQASGGSEEGVISLQQAYIGT